jgi:ring-1,2-phenylacetyl-CoA epoxidase subunit PaaE
MSRFHTVKIKKINKETPDCVTVTLDIPDKLKDVFRYKQGQYLTFKRVENGEDLRRSYSICSSPLENEWKVAIKKVPDGRFSSFANTTLKVGEELEVMPPAGKFYTELDKDNQKNYVAFAAGSGITPILSIVKTILYTEPKSSVTLIYGNRGRNSIIFKEEIEGLKNKFVERLSVHHVLSREQGDTEISFGRIDKQKTKLILDKIISPEQIDECFICGPEEMVSAVKETLQEAGVDENIIHFELFSTAETKNKVERRAGLTKEEHDRKSKVIIKLDGSLREMEMSYYGDTVLEAALANGADLPYSCKGGMCSTCRAKLVKGQVEMDVNYSLEPYELKAGYILTCQARPLTEELVVDFDQ